MKGQFFLVGAVIVCMLLYAGLPPFSAVQGGASQDMKAFSDNMEAEMPRALNIGINSSSPSGTLIAFCNFSREAAAVRGMDMDAFFAVFEASPSGIEVYAGNPSGEEQVVGVGVAGSDAELSVPAGSVNSTSFPAGGETFDVYVSAGGETVYATVPSNKTSLLASVAISRGGTVIREEILA